MEEIGLLILLFVVPAVSMAGYYFSDSSRAGRAQRRRTKTVDAIEGGAENAQNLAVALTHARAAVKLGLSMWGPNGDELGHFRHDIRLPWQVHGAKLL